MPRRSPQAILLVDGYNIVGAWTELRERRDRDGLEAARRELAEALVNYSAFQDFETHLVFDAQYQDTPGVAEVVTQHVSIYYTNFGQTADTYIERACAQFRQDLRKFQQRLIVATSDRAQQLTVVGYGAEWMSAQKLSQEVEFTARRVLRKQQTPQKSSGRFLANSLDPIAQQRLAKLRLGLKSTDL
ncbi:MAG: NYN domain-containing protein [Leptolyngbyaceae bacterium]|nr:NYN domain-containing protein [Leptolyngbyaceae bacterium]